MSGVHLGIGLGTALCTTLLPVVFIRMRVRRELAALPEEADGRAARMRATQEFATRTLAVLLAGWGGAGAWIGLEGTLGDLGLWALITTPPMALGWWGAQRALQRLMVRVRRPGWDLRLFQRLVRRIQWVALSPLLAALLCALCGRLAADALAFDLPRAVDAGWVPLFAALSLWTTDRAFYGWLGPVSPLPEGVASATRRMAGEGSLPPIHVLETGRADYFNAWALGGGSVLVTGSLLDELDAEESAAILMHELGHVRMRHVPKRLAALLGLQVVALALLAWAGFVGLWTSVAAYAGALVLIVKPVYQRQELEADRFAADRSSPDLVAAALRKIHSANLLPGEDRDAGKPTHPSLQARLRALGVALESDPAPAGPGRFMRAFRLALRLALIAVLLIVAWNLLILLYALS